MCCSLYQRQHHPDRGARVPGAYLEDGRLQPLQGRVLGRYILCRCDSQMHFICFSLSTFYPFTKLEELSRDGLGGSEEKEKQEYACVFLAPFDREALFWPVQHTNCTVVSA